MAICSKEMEETWGLSIEAVKGFLKNTGVTIEKANLASKMISSATRLVATENNNKQVSLAVLKNISNDPKEFKEYVRISNPEMIPKKALRGK